MKRIYIAGPFFSKAQNQRLINVEKCLRANSTVKDFYSPRKFQKTSNPQGTNKWGKEIYNLDMKQLTTSDVVVAVVDYDKKQTEMDSGTAYEIGAADIMNKPVVIVHTTKFPVNLMIAAPSNHFNIDDLQDLVKYDFNNPIVNNFQGQMF